MLLLFGVAVPEPGAEEEGFFFPRFVGRVNSVTTGLGGGTKALPGLGNGLAITGLSSVI